MLSLSESEAVLAGIKDNPRSISSHSQVVEAINCLVAHWQSTYRSTYANGVMGAPDWLEYEYRIWQLGECLRPLLRVKRWRGQNPVLDVVGDILSNKSFGKGRQTFALLLGDFGNAEYAKVLGQGLVDPEVRGHCLVSLNKAKIEGFAQHVELIHSDSKGWIKSAAKKYLKRFPG